MRDHELLEGCPYVGEQSLALDHERLFLRVV
jgi:hypothetical protein